jgi:hypothetical protein
MTAETRSHRRTTTLPDAFGVFVRRPSPWIITTLLAGALAARIAVGDWQLTDALVAGVMLAFFPVTEWVIHVCILHWRPAGSAVSPWIPCSRANIANTMPTHAGSI